MKQVLPSEMEPGRDYRVVQYFSVGTIIITEGTLSWVRDSYAQFPQSPLLNLHPYVGMPNVVVWEH